MIIVIRSGTRGTISSDCKKENKKAQGVECLLGFNRLISLAVFYGQYQNMVHPIVAFGTISSKAFFLSLPNH